MRGIKYICILLINNNISIIAEFMIRCRTNSSIGPIYDTVINHSLQSRIFYYATAVLSIEYCICSVSEQ